MTILLHNTTVESAEAIRRSGRIVANVERFRAYDHSSGPFFFLEGQDGSEVRTGGTVGDVTMHFSCSLPIAGPFDRLEINRALIAGQYEHLCGKLVIGRNDLSKATEQAIIIPDQHACLTLVRIEQTQDHHRSRLLDNESRDELFDVLLPTSA